MEKILDSFKRVGRKATLSYKGLFGVMNWKQYLLVNLGSPISQMLCFTLIAYYVYGSQNVSDWLIGNAMVMTYFNAVFGVGVQLTSEKNSGTLKLLVASPSSRPGIFLPRVILHIFDGILSVFVGLLVGYLVLGFRMPLNVWPYFILVLFVASFSAMAFGLLVSCFGLLTRDLNLILNIASMGMLGLTGANFPIDRLPKAMQFVSQIMPLTRSIEVLRGLQHGEAIQKYTHLIMGEIGVGVLLLSAGLILFGLMEKAAIKKGILELF